MGGEILEYEAKTIYRKGIKEGMEEGMEKGIEEGKIQGIVKMCKEFGLSLIDAVEKVVSELNLARDEAEERVKEYWN